MAKTRAQKKGILKGLTEKVEKAKSIVFVNFDGLNVKDAEELRLICKKQNVEYLVTKKTLLDIAMKEASIDFHPKPLLGGIALVFGYQDEIGAAKIAFEFAKKHPHLKPVAGVLGKGVISMQTLEALSKLPSRNDLLAMFARALQTPISGYVNVLIGNVRGLVQVLKAIGEKKI